MKLKLLFLTIYLITIAYGADDACVGKAKSQCTSANGCTWTKSADANCANKCSTLEQNQCTSPCSWKAGTCTKKTFTCTGKTNAECTATDTHADEFCTWSGTPEEGTCGDSATLDCASKDGTACNTAVNTCDWTPATPATCELSGTDTCTTKEEGDCTGTCTWTEEAGTCATTGGGSGSGTGGDSGSGNGSGSGSGSGSGTGEGSGSDSSGFLNLSVFICLFILFL